MNRFYQRALCESERFVLIVHKVVGYVKFLWKGETIADVFIDINNLNASWVRYRIDHFAVVCLVSSSLNKSEAGDYRALIETSLLFLC